MKSGSSFVNFDAFRSFYFFKFTSKRLQFLELKHLSMRELAANRSQAEPVRTWRGGGGGWQPGILNALMRLMFNTKLNRINVTTGTTKNTLTASSMTQTPCHNDKNVCSSANFHFDAFKTKLTNLRSLLSSQRSEWSRTGIERVGRKVKRKWHTIYVRRGFWIMK